MNVPEFQQNFIRKDRQQAGFGLWAVSYSLPISGVKPEFCIMYFIELILKAIKLDSPHNI